VLVNLGYGSITEGWSQGPANVPTEFGLFPPIPGGPVAVLEALANGAQTGIQDFIGDFTGSGPNPVDLSLSSLGSLLDPATASSSASSILSDPLAALSSLAADPTALVSDPANVVNTLSSVASTAYATLLPTADLVNALVTSLPAYDATLFLGNLSDPVNAIGLPIAADTALLTFGAAIEFDVIDGAVSGIAADFSGLIP
ncbi:MAG: PPE family protein, partial [Mycobacterium sp.]